MKIITGVCICLILIAAGCADEDDAQDAIDVAGTWNATIVSQSCTPSDVCADAGFTQGTSLNAIMTLTQNVPNRTQVEGSYTYQGAGISADLEGTIGGNQLSVNGAASVPFLGSITVRLNGSVSGNSIDATVNHQINLDDGRSADVTGTGTFVR
jgi:hypothetical protein